MLGKGGANIGWGLPIILIITVLLFVVAASSDDFDLFPSPDNFKKPGVSFSEVLTTGRVALPAFPGLFLLDFIFGKIPGHLLDTVENAMSAAIIVIALWFILFLIFADMLRLFGNFSSAINWLVAGLLVLIGANLSILSSVVVYFLSVFAVFGSLAIVFSLGAIIVIFIMFHFGSSYMRRWIIERRAEDAAIKAVAGAKEAAAGIQILRDLARRSGKRP